MTVTDQMAFTPAEQKATWDAHTRAFLLTQVSKAEKAITAAEEKLAEAERILEEFDAARKMEGTIDAAEYTEILEDHPDAAAPDSDFRLACTTSCVHYIRNTGSKDGSGDVCGHPKAPTEGTLETSPGWPCKAAPVFAELDGETVDLETGEVTSTKPEETFCLAGGCLHFTAPDLCTYDGGTFHLGEPESSYCIGVPSPLQDLNEAAAGVQAAAAPDEDDGTVSEQTEDPTDATEGQPACYGSECRFYLPSATGNDLCDYPDEPMATVVSITACPNGGPALTAEEV